MSENNMNPENNATPPQFQQQFQPPQRNNTKKVVIIVVSVFASLLALLVILGIVAAIALPALMNQRESAVDSAMQSYTTEVAKNIEKEAKTLKGSELSTEVPKSFAKLGTKVPEEMTIEVEGTFENYGVATYVEDSSYEYNMRGYIYYSTEGGMEPLSKLKSEIKGNDRQIQKD